MEVKSAWSNRRLRRNDFHSQNVVNLEFSSNSTQLTLSNPRFGDGQYVHDVWGAALPDYAIDGTWLDFITVNTHDFNVIAHSYSDQNPTFIVDLPNSQTLVEKIIIYPRQDGQYGRYSQMAVKIDNNYCEAPQNMDADMIEVNKEKGIIFQCNGTIGSVITVENGNDHLQIAEVVAFGSGQKFVSVFDSASGNHFDKSVDLTTPIRLP